jgi:hypothetical protein
LRRQVRRCRHDDQWIGNGGGAMIRTVLAALALICATTSGHTQTGDWREQYAYTLGMQAYIYGFPYVYMSEVRWSQVAQKVDPILPHAAVNHFWHAQVMGGRESQAGGSPNNDTLHSIAWLDLSKEPVILSVPDVVIAITRRKSRASTPTTLPMSA